MAFSAQTSATRSVGALLACLVSTSMLLTVAAPAPHLSLYDISHGVLSADECDAMVATAESTGWSQQHDSIEQASNAQDLYVFLDGEVVHHELWNMLVHRLPGLTSLVSKRRLSELDDEPIVGMPNWVFLRKYAPDSPRNSLMPHLDKNRHTVNVELSSPAHDGEEAAQKNGEGEEQVQALSERPEGGGLFIVRDGSVRGLEEGDLNWRWYVDAHLAGVDVDGRTTPLLESLGRANTSSIVFPGQRRGSAVVHNATVFHGVAPITRGARYSLLLFYDMPPHDAEEAERAKAKAEEDMAEGLSVQQEATEQFHRGELNEAHFKALLRHVVPLIEPAAELGDAVAQYLCAHAYHEGAGIEVDLKRARRYFERTLRHSPEDLAFFEIKPSDVLKSLGRVLEAQGEKEEAEAALKLAYLLSDQFKMKLEKKKAKRKKKKTKEAVLPHERVWRPDNKEIHGDEIRRAGTPSGAGLRNVGLGNAGGAGVAGDL